MPSSTSPATLRLGAVGIDSSHLPEFARRINALHDAGKTRCRVVSQWTDGRHDMPAENVEKWRRDAMALGVEPATGLREMLDSVDGVMVLAVNGHRHLELALPSLQRGLATYVDKPLTCDLAQARQLLAEARKGNARCYSASSLRFAVEIERLDRAALGALQAVDAFGPGELNPSMAGLFFYGVHTIEMVDAIWGPGVQRVRATTADARDVLEMEYRDGRSAHLRMERLGCYDFGATVHGQKALAQFKVDFSDVYNRLVAGMTRFFEGGPAPAALRDIVENVAVMECGNLSMARGGAWIDVPPIE